MADAISRLHDPAFFHALSAQLRGYSKQTTAVSLAFQNWRSLLSHDRCSPYSRAITPRRIEKVPSPCSLRYQLQLHTSRNYERSFASVSSSARSRFSASPLHLLLYVVFLARSLSPSSIHNYLNVVCSMGTLTPLKNLFPSTRKPSVYMEHKCRRNSLSHLIFFTKCSVI